MRHLVPAVAVALIAAVRPTSLPARVTVASFHAASAVRTSTSVPGAFAPGAAGWDLLGAGLINVARLVRRRRAA